MPGVIYAKDSSPAAIADAFAEQARLGAVPVYIPMAPGPIGHSRQTAAPRRPCHQHTPAA